MAANKKLLAALIGLTILMTGMPTASFAQDGEKPAPPPLVGNTSFPAQGDFPAVGFLLTDYPGTTGSCTATLVAPTWVLTAAHCVQQQDGVGGPDLHADDLTVLLNSVDSTANPLPAGAEQHTAVGWIIHGDYDPSDFANDVALIKLATPSAIEPVELATDAALVTAANGSPLPALVMGYGQNCAVGPCSDGKLRQGTTSIVSDADAEAFISPKSFTPDVLDTSTFTLPDITVDGALCFGDSGGPTLVQQGSNLRLAGVNSFIFTATSGNCDPISGSQYLNAVADVVTSDLADFINQIIDTPTQSCWGSLVTLEGTSYSDKIIAQDAADIIDAREGDDYVEGGNGQNVICGGTGNDTLIGGDDADLIRGQDGADYIDGGESDDTIVGGNGADILLGWTGNDTIKGGNGADEIWGEVGHDTLRGGKHSDEIHGGPGKDEIFGHKGQDVLRGNRGKDTLRGGPGDDQVFGGQNADIVYGGADDDTLRGNKGTDTIKGHAGNDELWGDAGSDSLDGGSGTDFCNGGPGSDTKTACE